MNLEGPREPQKDKEKQFPQRKWALLPEYERSYGLKKPTIHCAK
jgi:hypothetical protein